MHHRNLIGEAWTPMAIDSLFTRGELKDWREFAESMAKDANVAQAALGVAGYHEDRGSAALARILVQRFHPQMSGRG
jgi:hypothetical protein